MWDWNRLSPVHDKTRMEKLKNWRHNDRANKPWNAQPPKKEEVQNA